LVDLIVGCRISGDTWGRSRDGVQQQQQQQQHHHHHYHYYHHHEDLRAKGTKAYACKQHQRRFSSVCL